MPLPTHTLAFAVPGFVRLGRWHVQVFGLFSAAAIIAALWLSQRTARLAGIAPQALWDAGWFAIVAAFIVSRALLVVENWSAFLRFPLMFLALPSLTYAGMAITGLVLLAYVRAKHIAVLAALDAWAPCAALAAAVLSVGHFLEGTDAGMPTRLPWGVVTPGDHVLGKVHPVQLYTAALAFALCLAAMARLKRAPARLKRTPRPGVVAAQVLLVGGLLSFALDMLRQPVDTFSAAWLDPEQWVALGAMAAGTLILFAGQAAQTRALPERY
jgi:phosphatidylglycerol:prolipoprotein diacylglycerol transferase